MVEVALVISLFHCLSIVCILVPLLAPCVLKFSCCSTSKVETFYARSTAQVGHGAESGLVMLWTMHFTAFCTSCAWHLGCTWSLSLYASCRTMWMQPCSKPLLSTWAWTPTAWLPYSGVDSTLWYRNIDILIYLRNLYIYIYIYIFVCIPAEQISLQWIWIWLHGTESAKVRWFSCQLLYICFLGNKCVLLVKRCMYQ